MHVQARSGNEYSKTVSWWSTRSVLLRTHLLNIPGCPLSTVSSQWSYPQPVYKVYSLSQWCCTCVCVCVRWRYTPCLTSTYWFPHHVSRSSQRPRSAPIFFIIYLGTGTLSLKQANTLYMTIWYRVCVCDSCSGNRCIKRIYTGV